jgi:hypothetical protein
MLLFLGKAKIQHGMDKKIIVLADTTTFRKAALVY